MNKLEFLQQMETSLEVGNIEPEMTLDEISWDSLSVIIFIALVDKTFHIKLAPVKVAECKTVQNLLDLTNLPDLK